MKRDREERREKREEKMLLKNVSNQKNPPDECLVMFRKKILSEKFVVRKFRISPVFSIFTRFEFDFSARGN